MKEKTMVLMVLFEQNDEEDFVKPTCVKANT